MKIVGFESGQGLRLGVVEGDQVIDLQAADAKVPANLADYLASSGGDLKPLADLAKRAPASARRPLKDLKFGLPVARPGKVICLGLNYLEHVKEGSQRDNIPKFPTIFLRCLTSMVPHEQPIIRPKASEQLDYEAEMMLADQVNHPAPRPLIIARAIVGMAVLVEHGVAERQVEPVDRAAIGADLLLDRHLVGEAGGIGNAVHGFAPA